MSREREIRERLTDCVHSGERPGAVWHEYVSYDDFLHLLSIIDEQRAETERLRSEVRRWKQKYEMADTEW